MEFKERYYQVRHQLHSNYCTEFWQWGLIIRLDINTILKIWFNSSLNCLSQAENALATKYYHCWNIIHLRQKKTLTNLQWSKYISQWYMCSFHNCNAKPSSQRIQALMIDIELLHSVDCSYFSVFKLKMIDILLMAQCYERSLVLE